MCDQQRGSSSRRLTRELSRQYKCPQQNKVLSYFIDLKKAYDCPSERDVICPNESWSTRKNGSTLFKHFTPTWGPRFDSMVSSCGRQCWEWTEGSSMAFFILYTTLIIELCQAKLCIQNWHWNSSNSYSIQARWDTLPEVLHCKEAGYFIVSHCWWGPPDS